MTEEVTDGTIAVAQDESYLPELPQGDLAALGLYDPDLDFKKLALEAEYFTKGFRLVEKSDLENIPHIIIGVTYRPGFPRAGQPGDYVSIEAVVANKETMESAQVQHMLAKRGRPLTVYPNEPVVYNDSGTGVRRELTQFFTEECGFVDPGPSPVKDEPMRRFDNPYQIWKDGSGPAEFGFTADKRGNKLRYVVMRGLRRSDYEYQVPGGKAQPATTWYLG